VPACYSAAGWPGGPGAHRPDVAAITADASAAAEVPMMIVAVDPGGLLGPVLPELGGLVRRPLLTLEHAAAD
jgi:hypothetical protein